MNGEAVNFDELSLLEFNGLSVLQYVNTSKYSAIFNSGISVTVEGQQELLGLVTLVPTIFKGRPYCFCCLAIVNYFISICRKNNTIVWPMPLTQAKFIPKASFVKVVQCIRDYIESEGEKRKKKKRLLTSL